MEPKRTPPRYQQNAQYWHFISWTVQDIYSQGKGSLYRIEQIEIGYKVVLWVLLVPRRGSKGVKFGNRVNKIEEYVYKSAIDKRDNEAWSQAS